LTTVNNLISKLGMIIFDDGIDVNSIHNAIAVDDAIATMVHIVMTILLLMNT
jgi:hypothetical protein